MKQQTIQKSSESEVFDKTGPDEHKNHPSFHLGESDFVGIKTRCNSCQSDNIEKKYFPPGRRVRCLECGDEQWD